MARFGNKRKEDARKAELWDKLVAAAGTHRVRVVIVDGRATNYGIVDTVGVLTNYLDEYGTPDSSQGPSQEEVKDLYQKIRNYTRRMNINVILPKWPRSKT